MALSTKYRLPGFLIPVVSKKGRRITTPLFSMKCLPNTFIKDSQYPLFAIIVSKKLSKKAVVRNKIKRRLSEAIKTCLVNVKQPMVYIFYARSEIIKAGFGEIKEQVGRALLR